MFRFFVNRNRFSFEDIGLRCDVHSHILPGVDDGAGDFAESLVILQSLHRRGVDRFILTPHVSGGMFPNTAADLRRRFEAFQAELPEHFAEKIRLRLGSEYMIDEFFDTLTDCLCYAGNHILVEMSYGVRSVNLLETVFRLCQEGFVPVLAHPERYTYYFRDKAGRHHFEEFEKLHDMGCKFQLNVQSLSGCYGRQSLENLKYLLDKGWYAFVATDVHAHRQIDHFRDFRVSSKQFEKVRELARNNEMLF